MDREPSAVTTIVDIQSSDDGTITRVTLSTGTYINIEGDCIQLVHPTKAIRTLEEGHIGGVGEPYFLHELEVL